MEKKFLSREYKVYYYCDVCNREVESSGLAGLSNPQKYRHTCKCGETYWLNREYPFETIELTEI